MDHTVRLRVAAKERAADDVVVLTLAHPDGGRLPDWTPGAHIDLVLPNGADPAVLAVRRPLGPAHLPRRGAARARRARRLGLRARRAAPSATRSASAGRATTSRSCPPERYLFVAGGIGITPLLPMMRQADAARRGLARCSTAAAAAASMAFLDELAGYGDRVHVVPAGRARPARPARAGSATPARDAGLLLRPGAAAGRGRGGVRRPGRRTRCAPSGSSPREQRRAGPQHALRGASWPAPGTTVTVGPGPHGARRGARGRGRGAVVLPAGHLRHVRDRRRSTALPDHRDSILDDAERAADDCMFVCVSRSCTDRLVLDL